MKLKCGFCEHRCGIDEGLLGVCGIRGNVDSRIKTLNYGEVASIAIDPIEKKPFYHIMPGARTLSTALFGCNFKCSFCQNYSISQKEFFAASRTETKKPSDVFDTLRRQALSIMSYTYSEPTVWQDFMIDTARLVKEKNGLNLMVTNGYFTQESLDNLLEVIDGFNIDLKGGSAFYKEYCKAEYAPVLRNIASITKRSDKVVEVTTLVIENIHSIKEILNIGRDLEAAGVSVWHISRFHPAHKMKSIGATTESYMSQLADSIINNIKIPFLYIGNSTNNNFQQTRCPKCSKEIISREFYRIESKITSGKCPFCDEKIYGIF